MARCWLFTVLASAVSLNCFALIDQETTRRVTTLEAQVNALEAFVKSQQAQIDALIARSSGQEIAQSGSTHGCDAASFSSLPLLKDKRLSVSLAVPCVPRHIDSLRKVLGDVRNQTVFPIEVIVSLSQTTDVDGQRLQESLRREFFSGPLPEDGTAAEGRLGWPRAGEESHESMRRQWPSLEIVTTTEARSHAENNNIAAARSRGDIVSWFDADDRMHPRRIEVLERTFRELGVAAVLHGYSTATTNAAAAALAAGHEASATSSVLESEGGGLRDEGNDLLLLHSNPIELVPRPLDRLGEFVAASRPRTPPPPSSSSFSPLPNRIAFSRGQEIEDLYADPAHNGLDSIDVPVAVSSIHTVQHGHISVDRRKVLDNPLTSSSPLSSDVSGGGLGLKWVDMPTGGQQFGEDIRFFKSILKKFKERRQQRRRQRQRRSSSSSEGDGKDDGLEKGEEVAFVAANLTLYFPSWGPDKRCVVGQRILFDCRVTVDETTGHPVQVDFSSYDAAFGCPEGTQPGLYIDEEHFSKGVRCVAPSEREVLAPGVRYLDDFEAEEVEGAMEPWQEEVYKKFNFK